jgi:hypothetical protein
MTTCDYCRDHNLRLAWAEIKPTPPTETDKEQEQEATP